MTPIFADFDPRNLTDALLPVIAVTLGMLIPIIAIITEHFRKRDRLRVMEKAIEHGIDPEILKLETEECRSRPRLPYRGGLVTLAVGVGLLLVRHFALAGMGGAAWLMIIGGTICVCVGLALLLSDWINRDRVREGQLPQGPQL